MKSWTIFPMVTVFPLCFHKSLFSSCSYNEAWKNVELVPALNGKKQGKGKEGKFVWKYMKKTHCIAKRTRCNDNDTITLWLKWSSMLMLLQRCTDTEYFILYQSSHKIIHWNFQCSNKMETTQYNCLIMALGNQFSQNAPKLMWIE